MLRDDLAQAADLSAQLGGGNSGDCQKQAADLQIKIDAAEAPTSLMP